MFCKGLVINIFKYSGICSLSHLLTSAIITQKAARESIWAYRHDCVTIQLFIKIGKRLHLAYKL